MKPHSQIDLLKWMLQDVRQETLKGIEGLSKEKLFEPPLEGEYPIGAYLLHFAECEIFWCEQFSGEKFSEDLEKRVYANKWFDPGGEPDPPTSPLEVDTYHQLLKEVRDIVIERLDKMSDDDLETEVEIKIREGTMKLSKKWIIYHLIEHEAHHRGQMFMLMRMGKLR